MLIDIAIVIETVEMDSLKKDFEEHRIVWSVPWGITIILESGRQI